MTSDLTQQMKDRTRQFAVRVFRVIQCLPDSASARTLGNQLLRSATSVGANYRAACRARSPAEFRSKLGIVEEECDESIFWLELIVETELLPANRLQGLLDEANEILAIIVASIKTSKKNS